MLRFLSLLLCAGLLACDPPQATCDYINDYFPQLYQAQVAYEQGNYHEAYAQYSALHASCPITNFQNGTKSLRKFTELSIKVKDAEQTIQLLQELVRRGYNRQQLEEIPGCKEFLTTQDAQYFIANYDEYREDALSHIDIPLRNRLADMLVRDLTFRGKNYRENIAAQTKIDEELAQELKDIFEVYGYPDERLIGHMNFDTNEVTIWPLLLHTNDSIRFEYFVPKVTVFVRNGTCAPRVLGSLVDQHHLYNGKPQWYGTYRDIGGDRSEMISLEEVNKNRVSIGLKPLPEEDD